MTRIALDSNVLVYAELEPESDKGQRAAEVIRRTVQNGIVPAQVIGEFLRVIQRRSPSGLPEALRQAAIYRAVFATPPTSIDIMMAAAKMAAQHRFQIWDAVIWSAAQQAGASIFLSEDLQDGLTLDGLRVINPFALSESEFEALLN